jgi:hypothetical protein
VHRLKRALSRLALAILAGRTSKRETRFEISGEIWRAGGGCESRARGAPAGNIGVETPAWRGCESVHDKDLLDGVDLAHVGPACAFALLLTGSTRHTNDASVVRNERHAETE